MKKLLILALIGLGLSTQAIKAEVPDLSDWVPANITLPEADRDLGRAAKVILWAKRGTKFRAVSRGAFYHIQFERKRKRTTFDKITAGIKGLNATIEALRNGTIELWREGSFHYVLFENNSGEFAEFRILTKEQIEEIDKEKERVNNRFKTSIIRFSKRADFSEAMETHPDQGWADQAIRFIVEYQRNNIDYNIIARNAYAAYLSRDVQTPEIVELINSLDG